MPCIVVLQMMLTLFTRFRLADATLAGHLVALVRCQSRIDGFFFKVISRQRDKEKPLFFWSLFLVEWFKLPNSMIIISLRMDGKPWAEYPHLASYVCQFRSGYVCMPSFKP
ncbi:hypothetical protein J3F84DRAFT_370862 [Trichoderma pleuroticola]